MPFPVRTRAPGCPHPTRTRAATTNADAGQSGGSLCQEGAQAPCCTRDEGGPFGAALQGEASNSHKLLRLQGCGGERYGKGATVIASCVDWRDERKRTLDDASKHFPTTPKPGSTPCSGIKAWKTPAYCPCGVRCRGGVTPIWAFVRNLRTWTAMPREKTQVEKPRGRKYRCAAQGRTPP